MLEQRLYSTPSSSLLLAAFVHPLLRDPSAASQSKIVQHILHCLLSRLLLLELQFLLEKLPLIHILMSKWEGPFIIKESHSSGYYVLASVDNGTLLSSINGKWLKPYYS
ncbi:hypothetical protein M0R45_006822 [Rubus argutus]|uniref:Uncharacterized protein n=1 Tax=Rubus argutus TaxID=59490 RepID=A0AAW1YRP2_RUBAR